MRKGNTREAEAVAKKYILDRFDGDINHMVELYKNEEKTGRQYTFAQNFITCGTPYDEMDKVLSEIYDYPIEKADDFSLEETVEKFSSYMQRITEKMVSQYEKENAPKKTLSDIKKSVAEQKNSVEHTETNTKHNGR